MSNDYELDAFARGPRGLGPQISDRAAWNGFPGDRATFLSLADRNSELEPPPLTDEMYLAAARSGTRGEYGRNNLSRAIRLSLFVVAEGLQAEGRYLPAVERELDAILSQRTWVLPGHDRDLRCFEGKRADIDLGVAMRAWDLATAAWILDPVLPGYLKSRLVSELNSRVWEPYRIRVQKGDERLCNWVTRTSNWNAVCHGGVLGSLITLMPDPDERVELVQAGLGFLNNFLLGFEEDGYCSEGLGYWNYGFTHYACLAELVRNVTAGKVDLWKWKGIREFALFARRLELADGLFPAFADCPVFARPLRWLQMLAENRTGVSPTYSPQATTDFKHFYELITMSFSKGCPVPDGNVEPENGLRSFFPVSGVLVCRPVEGKEGFSLAAKAGHNAELHNHNDLGSFIVALRKELLLVDPGTEVYTARTFSPDRYASLLLNSYGHSVPVVAGKLQSTGKQAAARILEHSFSDEEDRLVLDLSAGYEVPELNALRRTFRFVRAPEELIEIADEVQFNRPSLFGAALITLAEWKRFDNGWCIRSDAEQAAVKLAGAVLNYSEVLIEEETELDRKPVRLGYELAEPVLQARITVTIQRLAPAEKPALSP